MPLHLEVSNISYRSVLISDGDTSIRYIAQSSLQNFDIVRHHDFDKAP